MAESRTLRSHRVIGAIADDASEAVTFATLGGQGFVTTRVCEDAFHVVKLEKLRVVMTSARLGRRIDALASSGEWTYAAVGSELWAFERGQVRGRLGDDDDDEEQDEGAVTQMLAIGEVLIVIRQGEDGSTAEAWAASERRLLPKLISRFELGRVCACVAHPPTYLNKVVVGTECGHLELWNVKSKKLVHSMRCLEKEQHGKKRRLEEDEDDSRSGVRLITCSGALDVVAVARGQRSVDLVNLRLDELIFSLELASSPSTLLFVSGTSSAAEEEEELRPLLVAGCASGALCVWDLGRRELVCEHAEAHRGAVIAGFAGGFGGAERATPNVAGAQAVVCTTVGADNAVAQWVFEDGGRVARCVRRREGHAAPPSVARWYGPPACGGALSISRNAGDASGGLQLLSASPDGAVRMSHAARDALNVELSQGAGMEGRAKKLRVSSTEMRLAPTVALAGCDSTKEWPNLVTAHDGHRVVRCWHMARRVIGDHALQQPNWPRTGNLSAKSEELGQRATSVLVTQCGNYALVGHADGITRKYNLQSGQDRGEFPSSVIAAQQKLKQNRTASVAVPGSVARASRAMDRTAQKGELILHQNKKQKSVRAVGAPGTLGFVKKKARFLKHSGAVTGLYVDSSNADLISASTDSKLKWWGFSDHGFVAEIEVPAPIANVAGARDPELLAVACDDGVVRVYDARRPPLGARLIRSLRDAHGTGPPRDIAWAPTFQTLWVAAGDGSARCFELASGACVDWLQFGDHMGCTAVAVNPTGEFLATTHVGQRGVSLWTDKAAYERVDLIRLQNNASARPSKMHHVNGDDLREAEKGALRLFLDEQQRKQQGETAMVVVTQEDDATVGLFAPLSAGVEASNAAKGVIRLSGEPMARLETLYALDAIMDRNRPIAPPKKPEAAPFFLPSGPASQQATVEEKEEEPESAAAVVVSKISRHAALDAAGRCQLATTLLSSEQGPVLCFLGTLSPATVDAEIAMLCRGDHDEPGVSLLQSFLAHLARGLESHADFEAVQAYIHRLVCRHSEALRLPVLKDALNNLHRAQTIAADRLRKILQEPLCLLDFFSSNLHGSA